MAIVKQTNKKTGVTYVYESHSYRDKETKQPRAKRKLIGRLDKETGQVVPTRKRKECITTSTVDSVGTNRPDDSNSYTALLDSIRERDETIKALRAEITSLQRERAKVSKELMELGIRLQK